jgi:hypothetical protein
MSFIELKILINTVQDRMGSVPLRSSRFKAGGIVSRRLIRQYRESKAALKRYYQ